MMSNENEIAGYYKNMNELWIIKEEISKEIINLNFEELCQYIDNNIGLLKNEILKKRTLRNS
jgi:hypothetical protein